MGTVIYFMHVSLDGYIEDPDGDIGFSPPADDVHRAANHEAQDAAAFLFGRRMYEVMEEYWTAAATRDDLPDVEAEFAQAYVATPRYVFSDTLTEVPDSVTLVSRAESRDLVAGLKTEVTGPISLGGAGLAASLLDLVDEFHPTVMPVVVGGGKPYLPRGRRLDLRLVGQHVFESGAVSLRYRRADVPADGR